MSSANSPTNPPEPTTAPVGLIANGSAGSWDVQLDEALTGAESWFLQIEGPSFYLYFQLNDPQLIEGILSFLEKRSKSSEGTGRSTAPKEQGEMGIGHFAHAPVSLIWDEESNDRAFILIGGAGECRARFTISGNDLHDFTDALLQVRDDLIDEGLLTNAS